jgi:4-coumarate--CoA ligase
MISNSMIFRALISLLAAELGGHAGRLPANLLAANWTTDTPIGDGGLMLDSFERITCCSAANQFFRLHEIGIEDYLLVQKTLGGWVDIIRAGLDQGITAFTFATSGSTGTPKRCTHLIATLAAEADHWASRFVGRKRIIQGVPAHHIYGFIFTVILPERMGLPVIDARAMAPSTQARQLQHGDLLVGFPAGHRSLLRSASQITADVMTTSSTAPLPPGDNIALRAMGFSRVTEIYGSTETAGIAERSDSEAAFKLLPRWISGSSEGELVIIDRLTGEPVSMPDRAEWVDQERFHLRGRTDNAVQIGGVNVYPISVAKRIAEHELVSECAVRLDTALPEPRLKAFLVLSDNARHLTPDAAAAIMDLWCRKNFPAPERPVRFDIGPHLPRDTMGKSCDWPCIADQAA